MNTSKKGKKIILRIKKEVSSDKARIAKLGLADGKSGVAVSNDLGCSDSSGCSTYCSES